MRRVLIVASGVLSLVLLVGVAGWAYASSAARERLGKTYDVRGADIPIPYPLSGEETRALQAEQAQPPAANTPTDAPPTEADGAGAAAGPLSDAQREAIALERAVARGEALARGRLACAECHGADGRGKLIADAQPVWTWYGPNITRGGRTAHYRAQDWDRIIRHGIKPDGTAATMPAVDFMRLSDQEVSDLAAYFNHLPPSDVAQPKTEIGPVGLVLLGTGTLPLSAEDIDHTRAHLARPPQAEVGLAFGEHVAATCVGCHRSDFSGGPIAQGPPDWPAAANLTPHAEGLSGWEEADFIRVLREGKLPDGSEVREPMRSLTKMALSDVELRAMFAYLSQIPAKETGE